MSEDAYDSEIAPRLLELAERCKELNMPFVAAVEYEPGQLASTASGVERDDLTILVPYLASRYANRFDDIALALARKLHELRLPHSCVSLKPWLECNPEDRNS
jgi:hypothetical protein